MCQYDCKPKKLSHYCFSNSRVVSKNTRHCQEPGLLSTYWSELFSGENIHIKKDDKICDDFYFAFQKLKRKTKQNAGPSSDMKLTTFLKDHSPVNCMEHKAPLDCALHCTQSLLASILLDGYVILLPEITKNDLILNSTPENRL